MSSVIKNNESENENGTLDREGSSSSSTTSAGRVRLQVFVEALCVDSKRFVLEELVPAYHALTSRAVQLEMVVFGNARIVGGRAAGKGEVEVECQHGPAECDANSYEQCAIHLAKQKKEEKQEQERPHKGQGLQLQFQGASNDDPADESLAYVACLFTDLDMGYRDHPFGAQVFASCARSAFGGDDDDDGGGGMAFRIRACHDDPALAATLQTRAAKATPKDHTHVPWILINGEHTYDPLDDNDDDNGPDDDSSNAPPYAKLVRAICRAYEESGGSSRPPAACE